MALSRLPMAKADRLLRSRAMSSAIGALPGLAGEGTGGGSHDLFPRSRDRVGRVRSGQGLPIRAVGLACSAAPDPASACVGRSDSAERVRPTATPVVLGCSYASRCPAFCGGSSKRIPAPGWYRGTRGGRLPTGRALAGLRLRRAAAASRKPRAVDRRTVLPADRMQALTKLIKIID